VRAQQILEQDDVALVQMAGILGEKRHTITHTTGACSGSGSPLSSHSTDALKRKPLLYAAPVSAPSKPLSPRSPGKRRPQRQLLPVVGLTPVQPRGVIDTDWIQSQTVEPGWLSDRTLDATGVLRLLRCCPTMLARGSVPQVLHKYRQKEQHIPWMGKFEEEIQEWQRSILKWLQAADRHGVDFQVEPAKLQDWIARAESMLPAAEESSDAIPFTAELVESARRVLTLKVQLEKDHKVNSVQNTVTRLYNLSKKANKFYGPQHVGKQRRKVVTLAEARFYFDLWRAVDRLESASSLCTASDFMKSLMSKYDNIFEAWDKLDTNGNGTVDFHEFVSGCRNIRVNGKLKQIFQQLSSDGELLQLTDLDPKADPKLLHEQKLRAQMVQERRLARIARRKLPSLHRLCMHREDLNVGHFDPETVQDFAKRRLPAKIDQKNKRQGDRSNVKGRAMWAQTSGEVTALINSWAEHHVPLRNAGLKEFHKMLLKKYKGLPQAWDDMDSNEDGVLQFHEFVAGCRKLQLRAQYRSMFQDLCSGESRPASRQESEQQVLHMTDLDPSLKDVEENRMNMLVERKQEREQAVQEHATSLSPQRFSRSSLSTREPSNQDSLVTLGASHADSSASLQARQSCKLTQPRQGLVTLRN